MKKALALLLCVIVVFGCLAGCGGKDKGDLKMTDDGKMVITINVQNAEKTPTESFKQLEEKFKVKFEFVAITGGNWQEKVRTWMAADNAPDVLWANIQNFNFSEYRTWASEGLFEPMGDLSAYPNVKASQEALESAPYFMVDGERYAYLSPNIELNPGDKHLNTYTFMYRRDWVEELGLLNEDNCYTWDEFIEIGKAMNASGKIGLVGSAGTYPHFSGMMQVSPYWEQYIKVDGKYKWGMDLPETLEAIKVSKSVYDDGVLWKDMVLAKSDEGNKKFKAGEAGIVFDGFSPGTIKSYAEAMEEAGIENVYDKIAIMSVKAPNGKYWGQESMDYWSITCFKHGIHEKKMQKILEIYDYILSAQTDETVSNLKRYGVEGKDFEYDENGVPQPLLDNTNSFLWGSFAFNDRAFNFEDLRLPKEALAMGLEVHNRLNSDESQLRVYDYPLYFFSAPNKDRIGLKYEDGREKIKEIITSSNNVEADWEAWKKSQRDEIKLVLDELNSSPDLR